MLLHSLVMMTGLACSLPGKLLTYPSLYRNLFDDPLTLGGVLLAMLVWTILYLPLIWYLEKVIPGKFGISLPFYFPLMVRGQSAVGAWNLGSIGLRVVFRSVLAFLLDQGQKAAGQAIWLL